jgi:16S rRNA (guanine527-N7)-methyltransferase
MSDIKSIESYTYMMNGLVHEAGLGKFDRETEARFEAYLALILRWNARTNLTAVRDPEGILRRHFLESIACAKMLPPGIATLLDFGSGAGLPGIPIALCRPEISVTLAESQGKKAAFLQEAVRGLGLKTAVFVGRAETLSGQFDCVTLRAVDRMEQAIQAASKLVRSGGCLAPMTTTANLPALQSAVGSEYTWEAPKALPGSDERILALASRIDPNRQV